MHGTLRWLLMGFVLAGAIGFVIWDAGILVILDLGAVDGFWIALVTFVSCLSAPPSPLLTLDDHHGWGPILEVRYFTWTAHWTLNCENSVSFASLAMLSFPLPFSFCRYQEWAKCFLWYCTSFQTFVLQTVQISRGNWWWTDKHTLYWKPKQCENLRIVDSKGTFYVPVLKTKMTWKIKNWW